MENTTNYIYKSCKHILIQVIEHWEEKDDYEGTRAKKIHLRWMSICHIFEEACCPFCGIGLIGKVITYDFRDSRDCLSGIVVITKYICLCRQATIYQEVRDFPF